MSEHKLRKIALDEITLGNAGAIVAEALKAKGCIVLILNENKTIGMTSYGVTHHTANELLSVGIHINLSQHDEAVSRGEAGAVPQEIQRSLEVIQ